MVLQCSKMGDLRWDAVLKQSDQVYLYKNPTNYTPIEVSFNIL